MRWRRGRGIRPSLGWRVKVRTRVEALPPLFFWDFFWRLGAYSCTMFTSFRILAFFFLSSCITGGNSFPFWQGVFSFGELDFPHACKWGMVWHGMA